MDSITFQPKMVISFSGGGQNSGRGDAMLTPNKYELVNLLLILIFFMTT